MKTPIKGLIKGFVLPGLALLWATACAAQPQTDEKVVLTSLAPLYQLARELVQNTDIKVQNIPERPRAMNSQPTYFLRQSEALADQFQSADAAIGISRIWPDDPLYLFAREANIRIVNVDAALPWSHERSGVALAEAETTGTNSPYFWTGPANAIRMTEIVSFDLEALFPQDAASIDANTQRVKAAILKTKSDIENRLLDIEDPLAYALTDELASFTNEMGIYVDGYFVKQDIDWSTEDLNNLTERLSSRHIPVVIHKWEPSEEIMKAITDGGARLVVLDNMELTDRPLEESIRANGEALLAGFGAN